MSLTSRARSAMILFAGALCLQPSRLAGAQESEEATSRLIAPYVTVTLGFATDAGKCPDTTCFPSPPMVFALGGGARVRVATFGERGAGVWASLGPEYVRFPLLLSNHPIPEGLLAAGRIAVGARKRVAVVGSTGKFHYVDTRGRIVQWRVQAQLEHLIAYAGVTKLRAMHRYDFTSTEAKPFRPRLLVAGTGFDF